MTFPVLSIAMGPSQPCLNEALCPSEVWGSLLCRRPVPVLRGVRKSKLKHCTWSEIRKQLLIKIKPEDFDTA